MDRTRDFAHSHVIDDARHAFWVQGYSATSISALSAATGLSVGSLYKAFGSKSELCRRTLDDYIETGLTDIDEILSGGSTPLVGLEDWLDALADVAATHSAGRGCYVVTSAIELSDSDPVALERIRRDDDQRRSRVAVALRAANLAGELDCDPAIGARLLCATADGVQVEARKGISAADARATLRLALDALR